MRRLAPTGTWLDVGCGPGLVTIEAAQAFPGLRMVGIDSSQNMIDYARDRAEKAGLSARVEFVVGDATEPAVLGRFAPADGLLSTYALHHFEDGEAALRTMAAALAPGGVVLLYDFRRVWWLRWRHPISDAYTAREACKILTEAGLDGVETATHFPYGMSIVGRTPIGNA